MSCNRTRPLLETPATTSCFSVSTDALLWRLVNLNLLSHGERSALASHPELLAEGPLAELLGEVLGEVTDGGFTPDQLPQIAAVMAEEGASFGRMLREPAAREAFGAFMEKRHPDFSKV